MEIKSFTLVDAQKLDRALNGTPRGDGTTIGGVGNGAYFLEGKWMRNGEELEESKVEILESAVLAEYDKVGGLIRKNGDKVKTGSFFDFKGKKPFDKPKVSFVYQVNGKFIEVPEGKELPGEVKAVKMLEEQDLDTNEEVEEKKSKKSKK